MNAKQLNLMLIERFPELNNEYHDEVDWQEGDETGSHVVYGDVFGPYLDKLIHEQKTEILQKVFDFIEQILRLNDQYSDEVIMFSVLERLMSNEEQFQDCKQYFGECTEKVIGKM